MKYRVRIPELRAIEGWYDTGRYKFKVSCRFNDILRCSVTRHFTTCFRPDGLYKEQPSRRCEDPTWVIIYVPDSSGAFMGRAFAQYEYTGPTDGVLRIDKIYGNRLTFEDIKMYIKSRTSCRFSGTDTYLRQ